MTKWTNVVKISVSCLIMVLTNVIQKRKLKSNGMHKLFKAYGF